MKPPPVDFMPLVNELRIRGEVLKNERAEYGEQMVSTLSAQLAVESASGWRSVTRHPTTGRPTTAPISNGRNLIDCAACD